MAPKAARCELRTMNALVGLNLFQPHGTLSALIQIRGHGIIATAVAPISSDTLVHGTSKLCRESKRRTASVQSGIGEFIAKLIIEVISCFRRL